MENYIEVKGAHIYFEEDKFARVVFKPNMNIDIDIALEITEGITRLSENKKHGNIVDASELFFMTSEARKHFGDQDKSNVVGVAIIIKSKLQANFANLYFRFTKQIIENRLVTDINEAKKWLNSKF